MFNVVTLILEKNAYGKWIPSYHIQTRKLLVVFKDLSTSLLLLGAAFLLLTLKFVVNLVGRAFKAKFIGYFKSIWNVVDLFIVLLAVATIALFFKRNVYVAQLILELEAKRNNEFVSFYWATLFDHLIEILSALLLCIATLRLWKILQFALIFRVFNSTLSRAAGSLLSTFLIGLIFLLGVSSSVYIINGYNSEMFAKPFRTITSLATLTLGFTNGQNVEENLTNGGKILGIVIYFLQMVIINAFLINMFIGIICAYFATVKEEIYLLDRSNKYSMWRYLKVKINFSSDSKFIF